MRRGRADCPEWEWVRVDSRLLKTRAHVSGLIGVVDSLRNRVVSDI